MKNDIFRFERELVLNAALKLINEGQTKNIGLPEISLYSGLAEGTVRKIFQSPEFILKELSQHITASISENIYIATSAGADFKEQFNLTWGSLFEYYLQHPQVISYMESPHVRASEVEIIVSVVDFFKKNENCFNGRLNPELFALMFHGSIINAARINIQTTASQKEKLSCMPDILWSGLVEQGILDCREYSSVLS